jgi:hypothetical protein
MEEICEHNIESNLWKVENGLEQGGKKLEVFYQAYWDNLVQYWMSKEGKNMSELNSKTWSYIQKVS